MTIEFNHCLQASIFGEKMKENLCFGVNMLPSAAQKFLSPPIAIAMSVITVATKIVTVAESLFKGVVNIVGRLMGCEGYNALLGAKQLFLSSSCSLVDLVIGAPIHILKDAFRLIVIDFLVLSVLGLFMSKEALPKTFIEEGLSHYKTKQQELSSSRKPWTAEAASKEIAFKGIQKPEGRGVASIKASLLAVITHPRSLLPIGNNLFYGKD